MQDHAGQTFINIHNCGTSPCKRIQTQKVQSPKSSYNSYTFFRLILFDFQGLIPISYTSSVRAIGVDSDRHMVHAGWFAI